VFGRDLSQEDAEKNSLKHRYKSSMQNRWQVAVSIVLR